MCNKHTPPSRVSCVVYIINYALVNNIPLMETKYIFSRLWSMVGMKEVRNRFFEKNIHFTF